jgi:hypothetical protein
MSLAQHPEHYNPDTYTCVLEEFIGLWNGVPQLDGSTLESQGICQAWANQIEPRRVSCLLTGEGLEFIT